MKRTHDIGHLLKTAPLPEPDARRMLADALEGVGRDAEATLLRDLDVDVVVVGEEVVRLDRQHQSDRWAELQARASGRNGLSLYQRAKALAALVGDGEFLRDRYGGDPERAEAGLSGKCLGDLHGAINADELLMAHRELMPEEWEASRDNVRAVQVKIRLKMQAREKEERNQRREEGRGAQRNARQHPGGLVIRVGQLIEEHPLAKLMPSMSDADFIPLMEDVEVNGVREPVYLFRGKLLDGRHRLRACRLLKIDCPAREWQGDSPLGFVISQNLHRRHLTSSQRAALAATLVPHLAEEARLRQQEGGRRGGQSQGTQSKKPTSPLPEKLVQEIEQASSPPMVGRAIEQAARLVDSNRQYVHDAVKLGENAPDLLEKVREGDLSIGKATKTFEHRLRQQRMSEFGAVAAPGTPTTLEQRTAYHEAGHAVVALLVGRGVEVATVVPRTATSTERGSSGHVKLEPRTELNALGFLIDLAGPIAEAHWAGEPAPLSGTDREGAAIFVEALMTRIEGPAGDDGVWGVVVSEDTRRSGRAFLRGLTRDFVTSFEVWPAVQAVATALLERKTLSGKEVQALVWPHCRPGKVDIFGVEFRSSTPPEKPTPKKRKGKQEG